MKSKTFNGSILKLTMRYLHSSRVKENITEKKKTKKKLSELKSTQKREKLKFQK